MLTGVLAETVVTFTEATDHCPKIRGHKVHRMAIYGWCDTGVLLKGERVKLECARRGEIRVTSVEAISRFFAALNSGEESQPPTRSPAARQSASEAAMARLRKRFQKA